jgi:hypothetical protein
MKDASTDMTSGNDDEKVVREALKEAFPAVDSELCRDLWPAMLRRIQEEPAPAVPWYDWVLAACLLATLALFPKLALFFAYHL